MLKIKLGSTSKKSYRVKKKKDNRHIFINNRWIIDNEHNIKQIYNRLSCVKREHLDIM
jgi:hypothetical protein